MPNEIDFKLSQNKDIQNAIRDERVFYASVFRADPGSDSTPSNLRLAVPLSINGMTSIPGIMFADEADSETTPQRLTYLVGMRIPFIIKEADDENGRLICSRKLAQQKLKADMLPALANKERFDGVVVSFTQFGAFVEVNGVVGLLRNDDYSTDHSRINERYKVGDHIAVRCKSISNDERKRIGWEAVTMYHRTTPFECDLEPGVVVSGTIVDIRNFPEGQAVFVRLDDNKRVDVLCSMPNELEIEKNVRVVLRVTQVTPGASEFVSPRVRGRIMGHAQD